MTPGRKKPGGGEGALIYLQSVSKRYGSAGEWAVREVSLEIPAGKICVLVGPSGCGKTTLLRIINRLVEPGSGEVFVAGQNTRLMDPDQLRRGIGYVIQEVGLLPHRTVADNIALVPRLLGWTQTQVDDRVRELLQLVSMDPDSVATRFPYQLSGGQVQRVGVARAMAADPPLMLMDEPFGAVDPIVRQRLQDEFLRLQRNLQKTICFVTHDVDEAFKMGDFIAVMHQGQILQHGSPLELLARPAHPVVRDLVGNHRETRLLELIPVKQVLQEGPGPEAGPEAPTPGYGVEITSSLQEALECMLCRDTDVIPVTENGLMRGTLDWKTVRGYLRRIQEDGYGC